MIDTNRWFYWFFNIIRLFRFGYNRWWSNGSCRCL